MKKAILDIITFLGIQALVSLTVPLVWGMVTGSPDVTTAMMITTTVIFSLLTIVVFIWAGWTKVSPTWLRTRPWMVLIWSVIAALGLVVPSAWLQEHMPELPNFVEQEFDMILKDRWGYLTIGLLAPLAEEIVFRGAALRSLLASRLSPLAAIVISALLFAVAHLNPAQMPHAFLVGLLLGWMYWRTSSILPGMAYHWANNSAAYVLYAFYPNPDIKLIDIFKGSEQHVYMALGFSLLILLPALYQLHLWMRHADE
ncbi:MAG: CPBP family intramembrane metalloprotease [Prevotella sp.]|nr:CPBP family intramembrane metalloprotease [Prevotella sp.]